MGKVVDNKLRLKLDLIEKKDNAAPDAKGIPYFLVFYVPSNE